MAFRRVLPAVDVLPARSYPLGVPSHRPARTKDKATSNVTLLVEPLNAYPRAILAGVEGDIRSHGPWSVYLGGRDRPPSWFARWNGDGIVELVENLRVPADDHRRRRLQRLEEAARMPMATTFSTHPSPVHAVSRGATQGPLAHIHFIGRRTTSSLTAPLMPSIGGFRSSPRSGTTRAGPARGLR
jgi:hypothetical protein